MGNPLRLEDDMRIMSLDVVLPFSLTHFWVRCELQDVMCVRVCENTSHESC